MNRRKKILGNLKHNKCVAFILPTVGINYKADLPSSFINAYITMDYKIIMVFDKTEIYDYTFSTWLQSIRKNKPCYSGIEESEDEICVIFDIPDYFKEDLYCFMRGQYSSFSEDLKSLLIRFFGIKGFKDRRVSISEVINPIDYKRKQIAEYLSYGRSIVNWKDINEVLDKPNLEEEMYINIEKLTEKKERKEISGER